MNTRQLPDLAVEEGEEITDIEEGEEDTDTVGVEEVVVETEIFISQVKMIEVNEDECQWVMAVEIPEDTSELIEKNEDDHQ